MNWIKLKEKFPNSEPEIREHLEKTGINSSYYLIQDFLKSKGYKIGQGFIRQLKEYEKSNQ